MMHDDPGREDASDPGAVVFGDRTPEPSAKMPATIRGLRRAVCRGGPRMGAVCLPPNVVDILGDEAENPEPQEEAPSHCRTHTEAQRRAYALPTRR